MGTCAKRKPPRSKGPQASPFDSSLAAALSAFACALALAVPYYVYFREPTTEPEVRLMHSQKLLAQLEAARGASHVQWTMRVDELRGLSIFAAEPIQKGQEVLVVPSNLMVDVIELSSTPDARSNPVLQSYLGSLPWACPPNIAVRPAADAALLEASPAYSVVGQLQGIPQTPGASAEKRRWAACMSLSRSFLSPDKKRGEHVRLRRSAELICTHSAVAHLCPVLTLCLPATEPIHVLHATPCGCNARTKWSYACIRVCVGGRAMGACR